ncbi:MAG: rRNA maturation RNase YbeY [Proteobacteria bacterium]|nr:rRNA maturation RNase YbeY [Pseudomonadota bacterium]
MEGMLELCHKAALAVVEPEPFYAESPLPWTLTVRLGGEDEARTMNREFRHKDYATNVLSFPTEEESEEGDEERYLGDVFICVPVVNKEAAEQGKQPEHHLAHMVVHGLLHLAGYDHEDERVAKVMESLERDILAGLGMPDPYEDAK